MTREELMLEMHRHRGGVVSTHNDGKEYIVKDFMLYNNDSLNLTDEVKTAAIVFNTANFIEKILRRPPCFSLLRVCVNVNDYIDNNIDRIFQLFACNGEEVRKLPEPINGNYYYEKDIEKTLSDIRKVMYLTGDIMSDNNCEGLRDTAFISVEGTTDYFMVPVSDIMRSIGCDNCILESNGLRIKVSHNTGEYFSVEPNHIMTFHDAILTIVSENDMLLTPANDHE